MLTLSLLYSSIINLPPTPGLCLSLKENLPPGAHYKTLLPSSSSLSSFPQCSCRNKDRVLLPFRSLTFALLAPSLCHLWNKGMSALSGGVQTSVHTVVCRKATQHFLPSPRILPYCIVNQLVDVAGAASLLHFQEGKMANGPRKGG